MIEHKHEAIANETVCIIRCTSCYYWEANIIYCQATPFTYVPLMHVHVSEVTGKLVLVVAGRELTIEKPMEGETHDSASPYG